MNAIERLIEKYIEEHNDVISKEAVEFWSVLASRDRALESPSPDQVTSNTVISWFLT